MQIDAYSRHSVCEISNIAFKAFFILSKKNTFDLKSPKHRAFQGLKNSKSKLKLFKDSGALCACCHYGKNKSNFKHQAVHKEAQKLESVATNLCMHINLLLLHVMSSWIHVASCL